MEKLPAIARFLSLLDVRAGDRYRPREQAGNRHRAQAFAESLCTDDRVASETTDTGYDRAWQLYTNITLYASPFDRQEP